MAETHRLPILIIGGGIGGLATALGLARAGRRVHVIERASEFGEIGAGLQIAPNAMHALDQLGVLPEIRKHAVVASRLVWLDAITGERISYVDCGDEFRARYGQPYIVMHRSDLLTVLLEACQQDDRITLETNRDAVAIEDLGDSARVRCADGTVYETDLLIGADGLRSRVRRLLSDDEPVCEPYVAYRGTLPMAMVSEHAGLDNVVMFIGPQMHFVQYPVRRGELYNQVAVFASKRYTPNSDDWGNPDELDAHYAQTCDYVRNSLKMIGRDRRWPMIDRAPIATWTKNRIVLMGDAAHPMLQYIAQGACQALEDSIVLAKAIVAKPNDPRQALLDYQTARYLRTARVQLTARAMGEFFHIDGVGRTLRNAMMSPRKPNDFSMIDWLYGYKP
ncbi:MAG: xlnD [Rhodospirillales bacterium]|jgi:2-polyprenyl-6-methoxyphenol hydroxylase-like FAD-dependent oxidoreductase|nr:xlnD [Rhodospirillales bacterium]